MALRNKTGVAFMHSHPTPGWQGMSPPDVVAERDVLAYPAGATRLPLVGLTIGTDGYWSGRFWERSGSDMRRHWCQKIRVVGSESYSLYFNDHIMPPPPRREILKRTFDSWGRRSQDTVARLQVGIIGLGSVGCIVAEAMARIGISRIVLIDPDRVEEHNLDRLLYGTKRDIGDLKVNVAARAIRRNATADKVHLTTVPLSVHNDAAYQHALDCDLLFSCVDRPVARDVLNYIAVAHLIPVIDGGIAIEVDQRTESLFAAHWRTHLVTPDCQCLRCSGQYDSSMVVTELDGSLDDPSYVRNLPPEYRHRNQNVFPFSLGAAGLEVNLMLRYLIAKDWWPPVRQQESQFLTGETSVINRECRPHCTFRARRAQGDSENPRYLTTAARDRRRFRFVSVFRRLIRFFGKALRKFSHV